VALKLRLASVIPKRDLLVRVCIPDREYFETVHQYRAGNLYALGRRRKGETLDWAEVECWCPAESLETAVALLIVEARRELGLPELVNGLEFKKEKEGEH